MKISDLNWMQVESLLVDTKTCVLPLGCTEQHAYLSLATDTILAEKVAIDAAEPLHVPVFPVIPYGMTPQFMAYPGTVSLSKESYLHLLSDVISSFHSHGIKNVLVVNGHGGNVPAMESLIDFASGLGISVTWHDWWRGPKTFALVKEIEPNASHASWMENFEWTRIPYVECPVGSKTPIMFSEIASLDPKQVRAHIGDGSFGGPYQLPDSDMQDIWNCGVLETRELLMNLL